MSQSLVTPTLVPSRGLNIFAWSLQILLAVVFLGAGGAKLAGFPMMVQIYDLIGIGQWFRIVTGLVEVTGAIVLLVPGYALGGAVLLACTMAGAVLAHVVILPAPVAPAAVLLVLCLSVAWLRRNQLPVLGGRR